MSGRSGAEGAGPGTASNLARRGPIMDSGHLTEAGRSTDGASQIARA